MKKLFFCIIVGMLLAYACIFFYNYNINPDQCVWIEMQETSERWERELRSRGNPCYIITGGSEVSFNIDPEVILEQTGLSVINAGTGAGSGLAANAEIALRYARPGDTLVLSILSYRSAVPTSSGLKLALRFRGADMFSDGLLPFNVDTVSALLRGEAGGYIFHAARAVCLPGAAYRYQSENAVLHRSGWKELTFDKLNCYVSMRPKKRVPLRIEQPTDDFLRMLRQLQKICAERQVKLCAIQPVHLRHESHRVTCIPVVLQLIRLGLPVLKDERLGVLNEPGLFADTELHFNGEGARRHSLIIAEALRRGDFWTEEELVTRLAEFGWNPDGSLVEKTEEH